MGSMKYTWKILFCANINSENVSTMRAVKDLGRDSKCMPSIRETVLNWALRRRNLDNKLVFLHCSFYTYSNRIIFHLGKQPTFRVTRLNLALPFYLSPAWLSGLVAQLFTHGSPSLRNEGSTFHNLEFQRNPIQVLKRANGNLIYMW